MKGGEVMERKNEGEKKSCGQGRLSRRPDELSGLCTDVPVPVQREGDRGHTSLEAPPVPSQPSSSHPLLSHSLRRPTTTSSSSSLCKLNFVAVAESKIEKAMSARTTAWQWLKGMKIKNLQIDGGMTVMY